MSAERGMIELFEQNKEKFGSGLYKKLYDALAKIHAEREFEYRRVSYIYPTAKHNLGHGMGLVYTSRLIKVTKDQIRSLSIFGRVSTINLLAKQFPEFEEAGISELYIRSIDGTDDEDDEVVDADDDDEDEE